MKGSLKRPDGEIYFETIGSGPALVFAHGLGGNYLSWWQQIPFFSEHFTCVTFSHRGFWPNAAIQEIPGIADFTDDLAALIDHLQFENVTLVAQSFGGWVCLEYVMREQTRVRALIMASTTGTLDYAAIANTENERMKEWSAWADRQKKRLRELSIVPGAGSRMAEEQPSLHYLFRQISDLTPSPYKESLRTLIHNSRTLPPVRFSELRIPLLLLTGDEDLLFPPAAAGIASLLVPDALWRSIPRTGHSTYFERPQLFNQIVGEFLSGAGK
jgi:pimeloyl-ACP methyl ester carboxylesterase